MNTNLELRNVERFTRFTIGIGFVLSALVSSNTATDIFIMIALSFYPLITALIAIDPILYFFKKAPNNTNMIESNKMEMAV